MGNANVSEKLKEQQEKNDHDAMEQLQIIHKMMVNKIAITSAKMEKEATEDKSLPIVTVVDKSQKYMIKVTNAPSDEVHKATDELMSGKFLAGINGLITVALNEFLGNTSAGETEKVDFHVIYANNSLLRLDYMMYKYEFSSKGLKDEYQNAFCYYMQVGVLDLEKVDPQILLYELTRAIGKDNLTLAEQQLKGLAKFSKELYSTINQLRNAANHPSGKGEREGEEEGEAREREGSEYAGLI